MLNLLNLFLGFSGEFKWPRYLTKTGSTAAPKALFKKVRDYASIMSAIQVLENNEIMFLRALQLLTKSFFWKTDISV